MSIVASRLYAGRADLQAMIDLLIAARPAEDIADFPSIVDLHEMLATSHLQANTRLWEDASGNLIGFTILDGSHLMFEFAPQEDDVAAQIIARGRRVCPTHLSRAWYAAHAHIRLSQL